MDSNKDYTSSGNSNYLYGDHPYGYGNAAYGNGVYGNPYGAPTGNHAYGAGNSQYYGLGNGQYYLGNAQYYGPQQPAQDPQEEEGSSFNPLAWMFTFAHYWYLFVIAAVLAFGLAMIKNRKWIPTYYSQGTIVINQNQGMGFSSNSQLMQGFGLDAGYTNVTNQVVRLGGYDLLRRVVDSVPFMYTEYYTQGRFKTRNLYRESPVVIETSRVEQVAYGILFEMIFNEDGSMHILSNSETQPLDIVAHYGQSVNTPLFEAVIYPTELMVNKGKIYFKFRSKESLVDEFMGRLSLDFVKDGSSVLGLSLISETPQRDCEFIDMLQDIYLLQSLEQKNLVAENSIEFIDKQLSSLKESLDVTQNKMTDFRQENKFTDVSEYAGRLMGRLSQYDDQSLELRLKETYYDYLTNYLVTNMDAGAVITPTTLGLDVPTLAALVDQLNTLQLQRGELTELNPYYAKYTTDIQNVKRSISEAISTLRATLDIEQADLRLRSQEAESEMQTLPEKELQMVAIERDYRIDDNYYTFFLQKRAEAEIQKASNTPDNSVLDRARTTAVMNANAKSKTMSTYLMVGLLIPLVLIVLSELLNNKIRTPRDVLALGVFRLIGSVRHVKNQNPTLVRARPKSSYAEMLRSVRTRVEFAIKRKENILLTITSTESGDGKTFMATNMASLYGMTGKKTILVDMDIRKPNIHTKLGLENGNGVTNYLIGDCELDDTIITGTPFGFDVLRAGTVPPNPGELIHSDKMSELLQILRERYTYIIVDTSPIGLVPDAYPLVEQSDLCLYVMRCMQTDKRLCKLTIEQMVEILEEKDKVQIVLSDVPNEGRFAYGGYGYGYGYGYGSTYGYGYGYGYGSRRNKFRRTFGKYYGASYTKAQNVYNYYRDDEEDDGDASEHLTGNAIYHAEDPI